MKKILAVIITVLMLFQSVAFAADPYIYDVPTNVTLEGKAGGSNDNYSDSVSIQSGEYIDFEAKIDMASVREEFETISSLLSFMHPTKENEINDLVLNGEFSLVLEYDSVLKLADSVVNGKNLEGFSASAKKAFVETKRTVSVGNTKSTLTIDIKVKNGLTVDELSKNINTYLADMTFVGSAKNVVKAGSYTFTGNMTGNVNASYSDGTNEVEGVVNFTNEATPVVNVEVTPATYKVTGSVSNYTSDDTVTVTLNGVPVDVNADGTFTIDDVATGNYTLVATKNEKQNKTIMVIVENDDVELDDIKFTDLNVSTIVEVNSDNDTTVGKLDEAADTIVDNIDGSKEIGDEVVGDIIEDKTADVTITTTVDNTNIVDIPEILELIISEGKIAIENIIDEVIENEDDIKRENLIKVETVVEVAKEGITETHTETVYKIEDDNGEKKVLHFVIEFDIWGKENIVVISRNKSDEQAEPVVETLKEDTSGAAGTYKIDEDHGLIHIYTESATADFAVVYTDVEDIVIESDPEDGSEGDTPSSPSRPVGGGGVGTKPSGPIAGTVIADLYDDIDETHWAYPYVEKMTQTGIMNGTGNRMFEPDICLTRASVVKMLACLIDADVEVKKVSFEDVPETAWHNPYIAWGFENGVVKGYSDTVFAPDQIITREEIAAMIVRFFNKFEIACEPVVELKLFNDDADIQEYAYDFVYTLQQADVFHGKPGYMFAPQAATTRAEGAKIFSGVYDIYHNNK